MLKVTVNGAWPTIVAATAVGVVLKTPFGSLFPPVCGDEPLTATAAEQRALWVEVVTVMDVV
jgi:hypothetical protein